MKYIFILFSLLSISHVYGQSTVTVNSDQTISINGTKFFPISVYVQSDYTGIKNMGVNVASRPFCVNTDAFNQNVSNQLYCHYTAGAGCGEDNAVDIKNRNSSPFTQSINQVKNSNYLFGYGLPDEPVSATGLSASDTKWAYDVIKAADPNHPVFLTDYASDISAYKNSADIFLNDEYPFNNDGNPLYDIKTKIKNMQSQVSPKPVWPIIQTGSQFGMPTNAQIRAETYLSLALGSTGLIFYSYDVEDAGGVHNIKKDGDPTFMKNLITELKNFSPYFLGSKNANLTYTSSDIDAILKNYNGKSYLIAVNKSTSAKSITFSLAGFSNATATIVGLASAGSSRTGQTRSVSSGSLSDTFQGLEAVVYEIGAAQCTVPGQPGQITGNANVTPGSSQTYSITAVSGATSYTWTLPTGWSGTSTSTSINSTVGNTGGTISVKANNSCGSGSSSNLTVTVGTSATNLAINKPTVTSSIEATGFEGNKAVDGNATTRWSSASSDPQWIYVDLGANYNVNRVKITWEAAYATAYQIQISSDASAWTTMRSVTGNASLVNDQTGLTGSGRYVRIYGTARGTVYGYSIFELEVNGTAVQTSVNLALNRPTATSSVEETGFEGSKAVDGSGTTRWSSAYSDPQWIYVDLGATYNVNRVKITWEAAYAAAYTIQISANASTWTNLKSVTGNTSLVNDQTGLNGTGRYVRINGTTRGTVYGYSIFELEVYGTYVGARAATPTLENDSDSDKSIVAFPNPTTGRITVQLGTYWYKHDGEIALINILGQPVAKEKITSVTHSFELSNAPIGMYIIHVSNPTNRITYKVYKKD